MAGQIIQRGVDRWLVRVALGRDASGKRIHHNRTVRGTRKDARRYLNKILREIDTGTFVELSDRPLADFIAEWLANVVRPRVRARTLADYTSLAKRHIAPALGQQKLGRLSPLEIQRLYTDLQERGLSARTVRYVHSVLHGSLEQAVKWNLLAKNPAKLVSLPRNEHREMRSLSVPEATRFLAAANSTRWQALWLLLLTTALRPGEALGLKWADLDGERMRIQRSLVRTSGCDWQLAEPKTSRSRRVVTIPATALSALLSHRARQAEERLLCGPDWCNLDLVFCTRSGNPLDYRTVVRRHFSPLLVEAKLGALRPYDLRHSCATLLLAAGENIKVVSERLGHASATLTLDTYSHVLPDMQQRAAQRMEDLLFGKGVA
jgi:integrase